MNHEGTAESKPNNQAEELAFNYGSLGNKYGVGSRAINAYSVSEQPYSDSKPQTNFQHGKFASSPARDPPSVAQKTPNATGLKPHHVNRRIEKSPYAQSYSGKRRHRSENQLDGISPMRRAEATFKQAEEYTRKIINRVSYLQHEEDKMKRKINHKVNEVAKLYRVREEKIA